VLLHGEWPRWHATGLAFADAIAVLLLGYLLFKRLERNFADRV
jgi:ABC-type polysaccharide/polyol phosphate export permease